MTWDGVAVVEIVAGREGLWGLRNRNMIPQEGLIQLRNATLEDHTWRSGGGASLLGTAIPGTPRIQAAVDYWPTPAIQRTLASCADGTLRKDNGSGANWVTLASGLTTQGQVVTWVLGGSEASGRNRKAFHFDRVNAVRVLAADGAAMAAIASPPADWSGANQPGFGAIHRYRLAAGGNANAPHRLYFSLAADHEDFLTTPLSFDVDPGVGERLVAALTYKGGLLLWKYPEGVWFLDTSDPATANWRVFRVGWPGAAGPGNVQAIEDDVIWVSPDGSWHLISAVQATGSVRASDLAVRKLGPFMRDQFALAEMAQGQLAYYSFKQELLFALAGVGGTAKNRRLHLDLNRKLDQGERWIYWDRDRNEALFLRKVSEILTPAFGDNVGQLWLLDRANRNANQTAYTFEWWMRDTDFSPVNPRWAGRWKNARYLQLEFDPRGAATHEVQVYLDGTLRQTISFALTGGSAALPVTLPVTLGAEGLSLTRPRRLTRRFRRMALRGRTTTLNEDASIARILIGMEDGE